MFFLSLRDPGDSVRVFGIFLYDCPSPLDCGAIVPYHRLPLVASAAITQ